MADEDLIWVAAAAREFERLGRVWRIGFAGFLEGIKMGKQIDDIKKGTWGNWTEGQEEDFVRAFFWGVVGFFIIFFAVIGLIS